MKGKSPTYEQQEKRYNRQIEKHLLIQRNEKYLALTANRVISQSKLQKIWNSLSSETMPKMRAYVLSNRQFDKLSFLGRNPEIEILEHGREVDIKHTAGEVIRMKNGYGVDEYYVFIRKGQDITETLLHEIKHIFNKDIDHFFEVIKSRVSRSVT